MMIDHDKLRELAQAATPGPWITGDDSPHGGTFFGTVADPDNPSEPGILLGDASIQDAEFIAAANPTAVLALLDDLAAVTAERDAYRRGQGPAPTPATGFQQGVNYNDPTGWYPIPNSRGDDQ